MGCRQPGIEARHRRLPRGMGLISGSLDSLPPASVLSLTIRLQETITIASGGVAREARLSPS